MSSRSDSCVLVFVKSPLKGQVKTRLAGHTGPETARRLYEGFVLDTLATLKLLKLPVRICFDPPNAEEGIRRWLGGQYSYVAQTGGDIGQKMKNAFVRSFDEGMNKAVLIGSDIPDLPGEFLHEALSALDADEAVVGPSRDGGYYLMGFSRASFLPDVFEDIAWSTSSVFQQTVDILRKTGLQVHFLPEWSDVDTYSDLQKLIARNKDTAFTRSKTAALIRSLGV